MTMVDRNATSGIDTTTSQNAETAVAEVTAQQDASADDTMAIGHLVVATTIDAAMTTGDRDATDAADMTTNQNAGQRWLRRQQVAT